jgi:hypothetical protein
LNLFVLHRSPDLRTRLATGVYAPNPIDGVFISLVDPLCFTTVFNRLLLAHQQQWCAPVFGSPAQREFFVSQRS